MKMAYFHMESVDKMKEIFLKLPVSLFSAYIFFVQPHHCGDEGFPVAH